jgi:adenylate kinase
MSEHTVNILVGLSGVGKGTVLEEAMMLSEEEYKVINYGDRMFETAKERDLVDHRDEMKNIDTETYKEIQADAAESIFEDAEENDVIVETHAAIRSPYGYIPGLPKWVCENLEPEKIIMLDASSEAIYRRSQESNRDRDTEKAGIEGITEYRDTAKQMASTVSVLTGAYFKIIQNRDGEAEKAAEELVDTLQG